MDMQSTGEEANPSARAKTEDGSAIYIRTQTCTPSVGPDTRAEADDGSAIYARAHVLVYPPVLIGSLCVKVFRQNLCIV